MQKNLKSLSKLISQQKHETSKMKVSISQSQYYLHMLEEKLRNNTYELRECADYHILKSTHFDEKKYIHLNGIEKRRKLRNR
jgi:hypothetical protein